MAYRFRRLAQFETICPRCSQPVRVNTPYALRKGQAIHPSCAPGGDDE